jgi:hypothetical protein
VTRATGQAGIPIPRPGLSAKSSADRQLPNARSQRPSAYLGGIDLGPTWRLHATCHGQGLDLGDVHLAATAAPATGPVSTHEAFEAGLTIDRGGRDPVIDEAARADYQLRIAELET